MTAAAVAVWAGVVLFVYYLQLWRLIAAGPAAWWRHALDIAHALGLPALVAAGIVLAGRRGARVRSIRGRRAAVATAVIGAGILCVVAAGEFTLPWRAPGFPALGEAVARAARAASGATAVVAAAAVVGEAVLRLIGWRSNDGVERLLFRIGCGLGTFAYLTLGLAALGLYTPGVLRAVTAVLAAGGFVWAAVAVAHRPRREASARAGSAPATPASDDAAAGAESRATPGQTVWCLVVALALVVAAIGALAPEREYDALWYHLTFPMTWLSHGRLVDFPAEYVALYPMTWELLYGTAMAAGGPVAAKLLHFACLGLGALLTWQTARRYARGAPPALTAALFVTAPTVLWEATTAYLDLALILQVGLALYALLRYAEERDPRWAALAAISLGLSLATKHTAFFALVLAAASMAVVWWRARRRVLQALAAAAALAAATLVIALPWYVRSWTATGNPVFPEFYRVFGAPADRWDAAADDALNRYEAGFGRPRTVRNLLTLPWDVTVHAWRYGGTLGPLFLILIPALLARGPGTPAMRTLAILGGGYVLLWASPISNFQIRFLLPTVPVLAVLASQAYARVDLALDRRIGGRQAMVAITAALLLLNLPPNLRLHERDRAEFKGWLTHVIRRVPTGVVAGRQREDRYLADAVPSYRAWRYINTHLPEDSLVLTFTGGDNLYSHRPRLWVNAIPARPATWGAPAGADAEALRALRRLGVTHILFDRRQLETLPADALAIAQPVFLARWARREYEDDRTILYALAWDRVAQAAAQPVRR